MKNASRVLTHENARAVISLLRLRNNSGSHFSPVSSKRVLTHPNNLPVVTHEGNSYHGWIKRCSNKINARKWTFSFRHLLQNKTGISPWKFTQLVYFRKWPYWSKIATSENLGRVTRQLPARWYDWYFGPTTLRDCSTKRKLTPPKNLPSHLISHQNILFCARISLHSRAFPYQTPYQLSTLVNLYSHVTWAFEFDKGHCEQVTHRANKIKWARFTNAKVPMDLGAIWLPVKRAGLIRTAPDKPKITKAMKSNLTLREWTEQAAHIATRSSVDSTNMNHVQVRRMSSSVTYPYLVNLCA